LEETINKCVGLKFQEDDAKKDAATFIFMVVETPDEKWPEDDSSVAASLLRSCQALCPLIEAESGVTLVSRLSLMPGVFRRRSKIRCSGR
jgi:hypothetical protein